MKIEELREVIQKAGGGANALEYADALLEKVNRLEGSKACDAILRQLFASREQGDFRGRVLEVNFVNAFLEQKQTVSCGAKQGGSGDVDVRWSLAGVDVFIELKLLRQDQATKESINRQIEKVRESSTLITDDTRDIGRIQLDLFRKGNATKFNPKPEKGWVNLIGIDVSELQLGMADICDCLLAAGGNRIAAMYCHEATLRPDVVGFFEELRRPTEKQREWVARIHQLQGCKTHPREYIHGALFLFREPQETAALVYKLSGVIVWNPKLVSAELAKDIDSNLAVVITRPKKPT